MSDERYVIFARGSSCSGGRGGDGGIAKFLADGVCIAALTVRWLAKLWQKPDVQGSEDGIGESGEKQQQRVIVCTGERMEDLVLRLYGKAGVRTTEFLPQHSKGLSNEFRCYANCPVGESG